jgi:iron complex transport system substrate-binding protein
LATVGQVQASPGDTEKNRYDSEETGFNLRSSAKSADKKMKKLFIIIALILVISQVASAAEPASPPKRIVSLAPSMTEILYALGLGDNIVGVTTFCDYPEEAKKKPKIGGMSNPSMEAVLTLKPDIVVLTTDGNPKEFETSRLTEDQDLCISGPQTC